MAVDHEIDGTQLSSASRRREKAEARGTAGEATCRRRSSAARVANDRGGLGKLAGEVADPGVVRIVGGEQLRFHGHVLTPACSLCRSWARTREGTGVIECGGDGDECAGQRREKERAARLGRGRRLPRDG